MGAARIHAASDAAGTAMGDRDKAMAVSGWVVGPASSAPKQHAREHSKQWFAARVDQSRVYTDSVLYRQHIAPPPAQSYAHTVIQPSTLASVLFDSPVRAAGHASYVPVARADTHGSRLLTACSLLARQRRVKPSVRLSPLKLAGSDHHWCGCCAWQNWCIGTLRRLKPGRALVAIATRQCVTSLYLSRTWPNSLSRGARP